ncbi:hypothetical protein C8N46_11372 [Kordia periserrulae]|uniref:Helix-turn-helix protein n=1 Tax=Kordia periserrulae TaxID=701523 RepID=A0A2T6BR57_9FLAO|nr:hypothetical protein [Kordia periserrulae]PTX58581.1 hypothetical protein C8N46_11372 [Kordia periserrulae]
MFLSPTEALKQFNVSKPTLYADMKAGKLSYKLDDRKKRKINVAELDRIYEKKETSQSINETLQNVQKSSAQTFSNASLAEKEVEIEYLKKIIEQYESENEHLRSSLEKSQDGHNRATLLLEDKTTGAGGLEKGLRALEARIANQEKTEKERKQREAKILKRNKLLREKLAQERNKKWYQNIFA